MEQSEGRQVCKFKLVLSKRQEVPSQAPALTIEHARLIPTHVKLEVWKRDGGRCLKCRSPENLHFDHIIPYSKGGSSLTAENIQLLCAQHKLEKRDRVE